MASWRWGSGERSWLGGACSLLGDISATQCEAPAECDAILGALDPPMAWACESNVCVERETSDCATKQDCAGTFVDDGEFPGPAYCDVEAGVCAPLLDGRGCRAIGYDEEAEQVVIGVLAPRGDSSDPRFYPANEAVEHAVAVINAGGLGPLGEKRTIAAIVCESDPDLVTDHVAWMRDKLGARVFLTEEDAARIAATTYSDVLAVTLRGNDEAVQEEENDPSNLVWRGVDTWESLIPGYVAAIEQAKAQAEALGVPAAVVTVAAITDIDKQLRVSAVQEAWGDVFDVVVSKPFVDDGDSTETADELVNADVDVVVALTERERFADETIRRIDGRYQLDGVPLWPVFVVGPGQRYSSGLLLHADDLRAQGFPELEPTPPRHRALHRSRSL